MTVTGRTGLSPWLTVGGHGRRSTAFGLFVSLVVLLVQNGQSHTGGTLAAGIADNNCHDDMFPDYGAYIDQWRADEPQVAAKLYPYGEVYCDTVANYNEKTYGIDPHINFDIPYYGKTYTNLWVSPCGFIALGTGVTTPVPCQWLDEWPNPQYPLAGANDPPFIAPFYSQSDLNRNPPEPSMITFRVLDPSSVSGTKRVVTDGMLNEISHNMHSAVLAADMFQATRGLVVTWHEVTFASNDCNPSNNNCARNTYQAAIVTDGTDTYTVFSYHEMTWVGGGGDQNCDRMTGLTSAQYPHCKPGRIGFNAGFGRQFHALPYSGSDTIRNIDIQGGSNHTGRFYYRVSGDTVFRGGCVNDTSFAGDTWPTEIHPKSGGMLGGTEVNVSGPCFVNADRIKCRYDNKVTEAIYIEGNMMRVTCMAPLMNKVGPVKVAVSIDGGTNFKFVTDYIVVTQAHVSPGVTIIRQRDDWLDPQQMELFWSPPELTSSSDDRVDIKLFGYREDTSSGTAVGIWQELHTVAEDYSNTGIYLLVIDSHKCDYNAEGQLCTSYDVGAIQISIEHAGNDPSNPRRIWSSVFPLGWYIDDAMTQDEGSGWIGHKCELWYYENNKATSWLNDLDPCPCMFDQAYTDFGRFQPDPLCRQGSTSPSNCERHVGAVECRLSTHATSSSSSGNECCYNSNRHLVYSGDSKYGSRPHRSHAWGAPPYMLPPRVPELSHWIRDVKGFYYCCEWQSSQSYCYKQFLSLRPTKSCQNYIPSGQATAFGDPHFETFDGVFYTFNGYGEYWLMKVVGAHVHGRPLDFKLHARFEQPANQSWGQTKATYMTAVGMQLNDSHRVVLEMNTGGRHKKLLLHLDDYLLDLTGQDLRRQEFNDGVIINNDKSENTQATNFTIVYRCGIGINVVFRDNLIDVIVSAPPQFKTFTRGLLGKWNDDPSDDLEPPQPGGPPFEPEDTENVHYLFGEKWRVTSTESCFRYLYRSQLNHAYYNREYFVPNFSPQFPPNNTEYTDEMVQQVCMGDLACTFDFKATLNENIGRQTKLIHEWDQHRRVMGQKVLSCGWLPIQYSVKIQPITYLVGSQVTITGCLDGYSLEGPTVYTCLDAGDGIARWSPEVTTICRGPDDPLPTTTVLAIAIPVALAGVLIIIAIIVIILVVRKKKKKKRQAKETKQMYVPVFQEIIEWRKGIEPNQPSNTAQTSAAINDPKARDGARSHAGMADFMGGGADAYNYNLPATAQKPPRPDLNQSIDRLTNDSIDIKQEYDNRGAHDSSTPTISSGATGNHVSWDTQDGDKLSGNIKPLKQSTLKSRKANFPTEQSPVPSPKSKRKRPYQYPTESRDNSVEDWPSNESPTLKVRTSGYPEQASTYKPRDAHAYTTGHNIPTSDVQSSNYYKRKYGKYNNTSFS